MDFLYKRLNNLNIKKQLIVTFLMFGMIPSLALIIFFNYNFYHQLMKYNDSKIQSDNRTTRNVLMDVVNLTTNTSKLIASSDSITELTTSDYTNTQEIYQSYLNFILRDTFNNEYVEIADIHLYIDNPTLIPVGRCSLIDETIQQSDWFQQLKNSTRKYKWVYTDSISSNASIYLMQYIRYSASDNYAILAIGISNSYLNAICDDLYNTSIISLDNNTIVFTNRNNSRGGQLDLLNTGTPKNLSSYNATYNNSSVLVYDSIFKPTNSSNFFKITTLSYDKKFIIEMLTLMFVITTIALLFPLILFVKFSNSYSRRLLTIRKQMHKIALGELDISDQIHGQDELGQLFADMHTTITGIRSLHDNILNEQAEKNSLRLLQQQTQFELLSSQINPHFLFNTLETIRMKALINNQTEIDSIIIKLGSILRYSLYNASTINTLSTELEYVEAYLEIQHFRFENKINYSIHINPQLNTQNIAMLPLLMQPVVENAILHGFATKKRAGMINISILVRHDNLNIIVSDNGCGIPPDRLNDLINVLSSSTHKNVTTHIGLKNVSQRIKLQYGNEYGLSITSKENEGTTVIIDIPYRPVENNSITSFS